MTDVAAASEHTSLATRLKINNKNALSISSDLDCFPRELSQRRGVYTVLPLAQAVTQTDGAVQKLESTDVEVTVCGVHTFLELRYKWKK